MAPSQSQRLEIPVKRNVRTLTVALAATAALAPAGLAMAAPHHHHKPPALWAAPAGTGSACTFAAPCSLSTALSKAPSGGTVRAMKGTYTGGGTYVTTGGTFTISAFLAAPVHLIGQRGAVINATGEEYGIAILGTASGSSVQGFTVEDATDTGIIAVPGNSTAGPTPASPLSHVTIADNVLTGNGTSVAAPGWGIHLESVTDSTVANNRSYANGGGIYLTDELGPTDHDAVIGNRVWDNTLQCGITLAGHVAAVDATTLLPPATPTAGVFDNLVEGNVTNDNGTYVGSNPNDGDGSGILMGGGALDAAVYNNRIIGNSATGNGLAGIVIHEHGPADLNGNVIIGNRLGKNNVIGDEDFTPDVDLKTTGILVASAIPEGTTGAIAGTVIVRNSIRDNEVGIWTLNVSSSTNLIAHNRFAKSVTTPISAN